MLLPPNRPAAGRLLIVEDDAATRFALARILSYTGYDVSTASTVSSALMKWEQHDCILLDLHLPDGLGLEVIRKIREKCNETKIAICSAAYDPELRRRVEQYRPDAVFIKPIDLDALIAWVKDSCTRLQSNASERSSGQATGQAHTHFTPPSLL